MSYNFAYTYFVKHQSELEKINSTLKQFWEIEDVNSPQDKKTVRIEEQLAMQKVENTLLFENQMYRACIPWKSNNSALPNNFEMVLRRLENTEKRLQRSPDVAQAYNKCIEQYSEKGYITKIQELERSTSRWYLPFFPVIKPEKETTKERIVFDASARFKGQSLNDLILQGPK